MIEFNRLPVPCQLQILVAVARTKPPSPVSASPAKSGRSNLKVAPALPRNDIAQGRLCNLIGLLRGVYPEPIL